MAGRELCQSSCPSGCHRARGCAQMQTAQTGLSRNTPKQPLPPAITSWEGETPAALEKPGSTGCCWEERVSKGKPAGGEGSAWWPCHPCVSEEQNKPGAGSCPQPSAREWPKNRFPVYPVRNRSRGRGHLGLFLPAPALLPPDPQHPRELCPTAAPMCTSGRGLPRRRGGPGMEGVAGH